MFKKLLMTTSAFGLVGCSLSITGCAQLQYQANETEYTHPNFLETLYFNNEMEKSLVDFKGMSEVVSQHTHSVETGDKSLAFSKLISSQIVGTRRLVRYHYLIPIENDKWCKKVVGASGTVYQITPRELVTATLNDPVLLEYYLGENEFYQYKDFIGQTDSPYLVWAATNIDFWVDEFTFLPVTTTLTILSK